MTDGSLLRAFTSDALIKKYDFVVLDECHERSLDTDILFVLLRRACLKRPDLKLIVMSATLDTDTFSDYFGMVLSFLRLSYYILFYHNMSISSLSCFLLFPSDLFSISVNVLTF